MRNKYLAWINMLKTQLFHIYAYFEDAADKQVDPLEMKAYKALVSVTTLEEFRQWRQMIVDYGLSFEDNVDSERTSNLLGLLDDVAEGASDAVLEEFVSWKVKFTPSEWGQTLKNNEQTILKIKKAVSRDFDVHIVVFRCGDRWAAIGDDADRLFEIFGWQTGAVSVGKEDISWMPISHYGLEVIQNSDYSVKVLDMVFDDIISYSFLEDLTSGYQQLIDYARFLTDTIEKAEGFMLKAVEYISPHDGYNQLIKADVSFDDDKLFATLDSGKKIVIADGNQWRLDRIGFPLVNAAGAEIKYLDKH